MQHVRSQTCKSLSLVQRLANALAIACCTACMPCTMLSSKAGHATWVDWAGVDWAEKAAAKPQGLEVAVT